MICGKCGSEIPEGASFCPNCGKSVRTGARTKKKSGKVSAGTIWLAVGVALALLVLVLAVLFLLRRFDLLPRDRHTPGFSGEPGDTSGVEPSDKYPDTVVLESFTSNPAPFSGQTFALNARVDDIKGSLVRAHVDAGSGADVYLSIPFGADTLSAGENVYINGVYRYVGGSAGYFEGASVTPTGDGSGAVLTSGFGMPTGISATVTDYYRYLGAFSTCSTVDDFTSSGGPLVQLTVDGGALRYTVSSASAGLSEVAQVTGTALMDGSPEISFTGDDGWGNNVSGKLYLYAGGYVAVESAASGGGQWSLDIPYTVLTPCSGSVPTIFEPAGDCTQELRCVSSGSTATLTLWNWDHGKWEDELTVTASIGSNGVSFSKREGDMCTPAGTFDVLFAFGDDSMDLNIPYYHVSSGDVWVCDPSSDYYNTYQSDSNPYKDWDKSENLYNKFKKDLSVAAIYFGFNGDGLTAGSANPNGGSDLFIDGVGSAGKPESGYGDIKLSASDMLRLLPLLDEARNPRIVIS